MATIREGTAHGPADVITPIGGVGPDGTWQSFDLSSMVPDTVQTNEVHAPAANTAAILTFGAAGADFVNVVTGFAFSYAGTGTLAGGNLLLQDGSDTVFSLDISDKKADRIEFKPAKAGHANRALVATLAAGGADVTGKLNALGRRHARHDRPRPGIPGRRQQPGRSRLPQGHSVRDRHLDRQHHARKGLGRFRCWRHGVLDPRLTGD